MRSLSQAAAGVCTISLVLPVSVAFSPATHAMSGKYVTAVDGACITPNSRGLGMYPLGTFGGRSGRMAL